MVEQPSGTVTLVFTDIEGSTRLLHELGRDRYREALAEHRRIVRESFARYHGYEVDYEGDSFFYAFQSAAAAVAAVEKALAALKGGPIRMRVGIHTGEPGLDPPKYVGLDVHLAARVMAAGHGGQGLLTRSTAELVEVELKALGEHRLKDMRERVQLFQLGGEVFPPLRSLYRSNLPVPATGFVGRERELSEVVELLAREDVRVLTLTGPGGTGKTRLALQAAAAAAERFPDGLWWVALAPLRDPDLVLWATAEALGLRRRPGRTLEATLADRLADKDALLLLDNTEHLLPEAARAFSALRDIPGPVVLATSRERIRLEGEYVYSVAAMQRVDAVALFGARTRQLGGSSTDGGVVSEVCARLDDLPLAVELAASRTSLLTPRQLLERLEQRLDLLTGPRDADPRQQTLRATIEWSYELLDQDERRVFRALSVFVDGCTLESAEAVCKTGIDTLQSLVDKSLIRRRESEREPRFWMLETIREFAAQQLEALGEAEELRGRHAYHFLQLAEAAQPNLLGADQKMWLGRLDVEHANLRAAIVWLRESGQSTLELRIVAALGRFWALRGDLERGRQHIDAALAAGRDQPAELREKALYALAVLAHRLGDHEQGRVYAEECLALCRAIGEPERVARGLGAVGMISLDKDPSRARAAYLESAELARRHGNRELLAMALIDLGVIAAMAGDDKQAQRYQEEALALCRELGDALMAAFSLLNLAYLEFWHNHLEQAERLLHEALEAAHMLGHKEAIIEAVELLAAVAASDGNAERASVLLGAVEILREETGYVRYAWPGRDPMGETRDILANSAAERVASAHQRGREMNLDQAVAFALST